jgi:transposase
MDLFTLGIDLGKTTFHLVGVTQRGEVIVRKRLSRERCGDMIPSPPVRDARG